jgi:hypothetical protein
MELPKELRILCIDDGVFEGIFSLKILKLLKCYLKEREIWESFDLICGTGKGGVLAVMIGFLKMSLNQCEDLFLSEAPIQDGIGKINNSDQIFLTSKLPYVFANPHWSHSKNIKPLTVKDVLTQTIKDLTCYNCAHLVLQEVEKLGYKIKCFVSLGNASISIIPIIKQPSSVCMMQEFFQKAENVHQQLSASLLRDQYFRFNLFVSSSFLNDFREKNIGAAEAASSSYIQAPEMMTTIKKIANML